MKTWALLIIIMIMGIIPSLIAYAQQTVPSLVNEVNNNIATALQRCSIPKNVFLTSRSITYDNNTVTITLGLSDNYEIIMTLNLSASQIPLDTINITVEKPDGSVCFSGSISIPQASGYNYYAVRSNYSIIIVSYKGTQTPIETSSARSVTIYNIVPAVTIAIPLSYGYITCNMGLLSPVYIVSLFNQPIMYITQNNSYRLSSVLCIYHQDYSQYFLIMAFIVGLSIAIVYEIIMLFMVTRRIGILH